MFQQAQNVFVFQLFDEEILICLDVVHEPNEILDHILLDAALIITPFSHEKDLPTCAL